jgi:hypothetical protein
MGNKKREFGSKFNYLQFVFGKPECAGKSPAIKSFYSEMKSAFTK